MGDSLTSLRKLRISCEDDVEILRCHFEDAISCDEGEYLDVYSTLLETPPGVLEFLISCSGVFWRLLGRVLSVLTTSHGF